MASLGLTAEELHGLSRRQLQNLAKQHNIRANGKSSEIVQALVALPSRDENSEPSVAGIVAGGGALADVAAETSKGSCGDIEKSAPEPKELVASASVPGEAAQEIARLKAENAKLRERLLREAVESQVGGAPCAVGDTVLAVYGGDGKKHAATVAALSDDDTVDWADGDQRHRVVKSHSVFKDGIACKHVEATAPLPAPTHTLEQMRQSLALLQIKQLQARRARQGGTYTVAHALCSLS